jgi:sporulation protein YlmC with PRC-barrel domain
MFSRTPSGYAGSSDCNRRQEERVVASEERLRELEEKYEGYRVYDNRGEKIGKVDDLFIDESDREEYIGVKMGFLGRKSTLIPMDIVRVNEADKAIEVSEAKDHVKNAPSFDDDEDITPEYEERIRSHFGLESTGSSQGRGSYGTYSGSGGGAGTAAADEGSEHRAADEGRETSGAYSSDAGEEGSRRDPVEDRMRESAARSQEISSGAMGSRDASGYGEETQGTPTSRETEETETFEEGGRAKVRRRIIREEIIEEDPDDRS